MLLCIPHTALIGFVLLCFQKNGLLETIDDSVCKANVCAAICSL